MNNPAVKKEMLITHSVFGLYEMLDFKANLTIAFVKMPKATAPVAKAIPKFKSFSSINDVTGFLVNT
jgi:hypothetical protein